MNPLEQFFESGQTIPWIETLNAVAFLGIDSKPKRVFSRSRLIVLKGLTGLHTRFFLIVA
jgi:hypothetical protein